MRAAFTLIEVMAAVFLTAIAMTVAISFFVDLSDATDAAAVKARQGRLALAVIDRVARDIEGAYLLAKPPEVDPLFHPWVFIAESDYAEEASDRLLFVTRNHRPRNPLDHGSDLALVTYLLRPAEEGPGFELLRAVTPGLPAEGDRDFPSASDERFQVIAERIERFGIRFMGDDFEWYEAWDSSQLAQSSALPRAAEIELAYLPEDTDESFDDFGTLGAFDAEIPLYQRRIRLPLRSVDLATMLQTVEEEAAAVAAEEAEEEGEDLDPELLEGLDDVDLPEGFDRELLEQILP